MKQKLNAKDFILIGVLTALMWIICMVISTIMSVAGPVTNVFYPSVVAIPNGIVMMLLLAKVPKKGVFTICAAIQAILFLLVGAFWFIPIGLVIGGIICDFLVMSRNEITMKSMMAAYALFSAIFAFSAICPIKNVSFEAHAGDVIGILGHNGAGKTTLLSILTGLLKQQRGEVCFDGKKLTPRQRRSLSYLVMQDTDYQLFASSVEEELSLGMRDDCKEKVDETLKALELSDYRERHPASLSGAQKQRVTIGAAIVKGSPVIYFDEPTSGLDYDSMVRVSKLIEQLSSSGVIVFVVSHDFEFIVRTCTEVVQLDDDGAIQNQRLSPEILKTLSEKYFT